MTTSKSKILFKMTGSIACYKACGLISKLVQSGFEVQVVASASALKFVGAATLEGLTAKPVATDLWEQGKAMDHIRLARWADLIIVAPASANFINKAAHGLGEDLLTTLFLAHDFSKPYLIAPAMNTTMYQHPATQNSLETLKGFGVEILEAASGVLACGESGYGKLLDPDLIFKDIKKHFVPAIKNPRKILVTAGGTQEPIDDVRVITNKSTGTTAANIADELIESGMDVTFLHAENSVLPKKSCTRVSFSSFSELSKNLEALLSKQGFNAVIHASAVSDYSVVSPISSGKLSSENDELTLTLRKNPKLVSLLRDFAKNPNLKVVAFKMTSNPSASTQGLAVNKLFSQSHPDLIIHNDLSEIDRRQGRHLFHWCVPGKTFEENLVLESSKSLSKKLVEYLNKKIS